MSKGLEALKEIVDYAINEFTDNEKKYQKDLEIIEKELKALEIIREKKVDTGLLRYWWSCDYTDVEILKRYNFFINRKPLVQEEYDLLKEVLL